jgi:hypothetical protein
MVKRLTFGFFLLSFLTAGFFLASQQPLQAATSKDKKAEVTKEEADSDEALEEESGDEAEVKEEDLPDFYLAQAKGEVFVVHKGNKKKADPPQQVEADDKIVTGKDGKAFLQFKSGGTLEVGPKSEVKVSKLEINSKAFKVRFQIAIGKMKTVLKKLTQASSSFEIEAGGVVAGVRGTTFEVDYNKAKNEVATKTYEGSVFTRVGGKENIVEKGFALVVGKGGNPVLSALGGSDVADFVEFLEAADDLEKQKEIILKHLQKKIIDDITKKALGDHGNPVDKALQFRF